jgi:putative ABC transport system permease protein
VTPERLAVTPAAIGASASAGPLPLVGGTFEAAGHKLSNLLVIGRDDPGGPVADLTVVAGRWVRSPDEIVLTRSFASFHHVALGDRVTWLGSADKPVFRVVGEAVDVDEGDAETSSQSLWVIAARAPALSEQWKYVMYYRFPGTPSEAQLRDDVSRLRSGLPAGALAATLPALRAGRLSAVRAIAEGTAPQGSSR